MGVKRLAYLLFILLQLSAYLFVSDIYAVPAQASPIINYFTGIPTGYAEIIADNNNNIWVGDSAANTVTELSNTGSVIHTYTGLSVTPWGLAKDQNGNILVAGAKTGGVGVTVVSPSTGVGTTYTVSGTAANQSYITVDSSNNYWINNYQAGAVYELSSTGSLLNTFSGIYYPQSMIVDHSNNIWIANWVNELITKIASGKVTTYGASDALILAVDPSNNIWYTDNNDNKVIELSNNGSQIGSHTVGSAPKGVAIDQNGNIWVANTGSTYLTELSPSGALIQNLTLSINPYFVTVDSSNNLWVTSTGNEVAKINLNLSPYSINTTLTTDLTTGFPVLNYTPPSNASQMYIYRNGTQIANPSLTATSYEDNTLTSPGTYSYYVLATNAGGSTASNTVSFTATAPTSPALSESITAVNQSTLSWPAGAYTQVQVFRNNSLLATLAGTATSYQDTVTAAGNYIYYIEVTNSYGYAASNTVSMSAQAPGTFSITIGTSPNGFYPLINYALPTNTTSAELYRNGSMIATLNTAANLYTDSSLTAANTYNYYIVAYNAVGNSASNIVGYTTAAPAAINLQGNVSSATYASLSWNAVSCSGFTVYRNGTDIASLSNTTTTYSETLPGAIQTYYVTATNPYGTTASNSTTLVMTGPSAFNISMGLDPTGWYPVISFSLPSNSTSAAVYRDGQQVATLSSSQTSYMDATLSIAGNHAYYVSAINASGSTISNTVTFTANAPAAPRLSLSYDKSNTKNITLSWTSKSVISYNVIKNGSVIANVPSTETTYQYSMATATDPTYQIGAVNPYGTSYSNVIDYNPNVPPAEGVPFSFPNAMSWATIVVVAISGIIALILGYVIVRDFIIPGIGRAVYSKGNSYTHIGYVPNILNTYVPRIVDVEAATSEYLVETKDYTKYKPPELPPNPDNTKSAPKYSPPEVKLVSIVDKDAYSPEYHQLEDASTYRPENAEINYRPAYSPRYRPQGSNWGDYKPSS